MQLGESPTGRVVNVTRLVLVFAGLATTLVAIVSAASLLLFQADLAGQRTRLTATAATFVAALVLFRVAQSFSINAYPFLIPDVIREAYKNKVAAADTVQLVQTLEANTGSAAFFNRIGFSGVSLGTIASAFLVLILGLFARRFGYIEEQDFATFMDLAKLLFGAFVGSFASRMPINQEARLTPAVPVAPPAVVEVAPAVVGPAPGPPADPGAAGG